MTGQIPVQEHHAEITMTTRGTDIMTGTIQLKTDRLILRRHGARLTIWDQQKQ